MISLRANGDGISVRGMSIKEILKNTIMLSLFPVNFFLFIAAPPSRGVDHGAGSNFTPTVIIKVI